MNTLTTIATGEVGYLTDDPARRYAAMLDRCTSLAGLRRSLQRWRDVAVDAVEMASEMTEADFAEFKAGRKRDQAGDFPGEEWARRYGPLAMPETLLILTLMASRFGAPWGTAAIQSWRAGSLVADGGALRFVRAELAGGE